MTVGDALLSTEQEALRRVAVEIGDEVAVRGVDDLDVVDVDRAWGEVARAGLLGMRQHEEGRWSGAVESALAAEGLARSLAPMPYVLSGVLPYQLLVACGADQEAADHESQRHRYGVALTVTGERIVDVEVDEPRLHDESGVDAVLGLADRAGGWQVVRAAVVASEPTYTADLGRSAVDLPGLAWQPVGDRLLTAEDLTGWRALGLTLLAADTTGVMRTALERTLEHARTRVTYGATIDSYQVVQHLLADLWAALEGTWSAVLHAAWAGDATEPETALAAALAASVRAARAGRSTVETAMQLHGGLGQTWEHFGHLALRRVSVNSHLLGGTERALQQLAGCLLEGR